MTDSKLITQDSLSEQCYKSDGFNPATEVENYSYTSGRVKKNVYNKYNTQNKPKVFGYYTDWSQYDGRLDGLMDKPNRGRGIDLATLSPTAYDKLIIGFLGIVGDQGEKAATINTAASQTNKVQDEPTFLDPWGDFQSSRNCNVPSGWVDIQPATVTQEQSKGVIGGLRELQKQAKSQGHDLVLSMSIGGWTMSNGFHNMSKSDSRRKTFAAGVVKLFKQFPMFSEVDIDWEYPNNPGNNNPYGPEDGDNYVLLMKELRGQLDKVGRNDVKISIASSAVVETLGYSNVKQLLDAGLYAINVMTYDFFGTPWATELTHQTNLLPLKTGGWSVDSVVQYLIKEGFPSDRINIGYAAYSRNGRNTQIETFSPLKGTYSPGQGTTTGTFESGCSEWYDIIYNYLDLENKQGRNGFNVYTDKIADADYLYNPQSKLFMSFDTPRAVKAKGEYAVKHQLGGVFTWTIEQDNGVLVNAAREGLGCTIQNKVIDMAPFYFEGINITGDVPAPTPEPIPTPENQPPKGNIALQVMSGSVVQLSAEGSTDAEGDPLSYEWTVPTGITANSNTAAVLEFTAPTVTATTRFTFSLIVKDSKGASSASVSYSLKVVPTNTPVPVPEPTPEPTPTPQPSGDYPQWQASVAYNSNEKVSWKGKNYQAQWWTKGDEPGTTSGTGEGKPWKIIQ